MKEKKLTPAVWLRILTSKTISTADLALAEGCSVKKAREIVRFINGDNAYCRSCPTDEYLRQYKGTSRKEELRLIYSKE